MVIEEDWNAAMSSEIFREFVKGELIKDANAKQVAPVDEAEALNEFDEFQHRVRETPHLRRAFKTLQQKFANDPAYRSRVDAKFAEGVMLLNLEEE